MNENFNAIKALLITKLKYKVNKPQGRDGDGNTLENRELYNYIAWKLTNIFFIHYRFVTKY